MQRYNHLELMEVKDLYMLEHCLGGQLIVPGKTVLTFHGKGKYLGGLIGGVLLGPQGVPIGTKIGRQIADLISPPPKISLEIVV